MSDRSAIIIGASSGVGRAIAEDLASNGWDLVVGARHHATLDELSSELRDAHRVAVTPVAVDLSGSDDELRRFIEEADRYMPRPEAVLITVGDVADVDEGLEDWSTTNDLVATNMTGVMKMAGHFVGEFERRENGTLVLFSSIAAGSPRRRNVAYAAAKAGLESFARSMQHRLGRSDAAVQLYRLGYVDTRLAKGEDLKLRPRDPKKVAGRVVRGLGGPSRIVFEPRYWALIVRGLRLLPRSFYNRLDF